MQTINLMHPENSDVKYELIQFPDGEPHLKFISEINHKEKFSVISRITNPIDLFILMQAGRILNRHGVQFVIFIPYLMSMRMDRVISFQEDYSLELVANLINSLHAKQIFLFEPHSLRSVELIKNSKIIPVTSHVLKEHLTEDSVICYPDVGAKGRYGLLPNPFVTFTKKRDPNTGRILSLEVEETNLEEKAKVPSIIVIDDLCDGGGTFALVANKLKELYPDAKLTIIVGHMVNPKGIETLHNNYNQVYFTNTYKDWKVDYENVKVINFISKFL